MAGSKAKGPEPPETLAQLESRGERVMEWIGNNARIVLSVAAAALLIAGIVGYVGSRRDKHEQAASAALAKTRADYLVAMGASPEAISVPELANPAAGNQIRAQYRERFAAIADEFPDTAAGALARLEQGDLTESSGDPVGARAIWDAALAALPADSPLAGLLHQRIGRSLEDAGDWNAAADAYAAAAALAGYTFRYWAMAEAARCYVAAEQPAKALELYARIEAEAPDFELPDDLRVKLLELRAANPS